MTETHEMTARTGLTGKDNQERTTRRGQPGKNNPDGTAKIERQGQDQDKQDSQDGTAREETRKG
jgi:hypothetical protein